MSKWLNHWDDDISVYVLVEGRFFKRRKAATRSIQVNNLTASAVQPETHLMNMTPTS